ncbi:hypothetical protein H0H87_012148 [Tephrocybe sp. NHM501043]|nr:hypothetical protein H0H87_012148 [Tephrocybe sp. NHM501043]
MICAMNSSRASTKDLIAFRNLVLTVMDSDKMAVDAAPNDEKKLQPDTAETVPEAAPAETASDAAQPAISNTPVPEGSSLEAPTNGVIGGGPETKDSTKQNPALAAEEGAITTELAQPASPMPLDETPGAGPSTLSERPPPADAQTSYPTTTLDRPLNVTDALSYLDAVKVQFSDQPTVYNQFLDIMKEFKNEKIDTPGVIKRVSQLFNGHPILIQGFNTFLPAGYRIECTEDLRGGGLITVTTPSGRQMQTTNNGGKGPIIWLEDGVPEPAPTPTPTPTPAPAPQVPPSFPANGQAIEPAVQYVQKIKQRCDPDTYRQFLDILSQYHSNPDTIDEEEVSRQIARLFKDAPDLRSDFRIFMPERSQSNLDDPLPTRTGTPSADARGKRKLDTVANNASLPQKRKRKAAEKSERETVPSRPSASSSKVKKPKHAVGQDLTPSSYSKIIVPPSPPRQARLPPQPPPPPIRMPPPNDDSQFFDNVRRILDNRDTYNEFLKIVNLFTQDLIDSTRLVHEARNFLGDSELLKQLKGILGWNERKDREAYDSEIQQQSWTRPVVVGLASRPTQAELNMKFGSYRRLPPSEVNVPCTGRDEMCRSVLNDEWVSHPTWSSEDSGFVAHRKNIYEEALHRSEEERHEYDFHIDAIVRTIALLDPIHNKITQTNQDDRPTFKLKPNMGGTWKPLHTRVIKKLYGRDAAREVILAMQDTPHIAVPVVLNRLKQKEEEWKRAQREWNKVWREVDARNYTKSLDHQGIFFKATDKKANTVKAFVNQIEAAREEQIAKRASLIDPLFARTRPRHQLEFVVDDVTVLQDVLKLTFSFLDRTQGQINFVERKRIEGFLRSFVPLFFMLDPVAFNTCFIVVHETYDGDMSDEVGSIVDDVEVASMTSGSSRRNSRKGANLSSGGDLRKKLLKSEQVKATIRKTRAQEAASPIVSRLASPVLVEENSTVDPFAHTRKLSRKNIFFTNTVFYSLLRLIEVLYSRLSLFKSIGARLAAAGPSRHNPVTVELQIPPVDSANFVDRTGKAEHLYDWLLESVERLFDNEIEQHVFEDQMRSMFGTKEAYKSFTIDKVIGAIIKQVQAVFADPRSQDILEILKKERSLVSPTTQDQINSRRNAEKVLGPDENIFRIDWLPESRTMTVQLIGKDDSSFDDSEVLTGRWQSYIDSYVSDGTTEGVSPSKVRSPFLRRNLAPTVLGVPPNAVSQDGLEIKVCVRTYRLFFVSNTEDFMWKISFKEETKEAIKRLASREKLRKKWLEEALKPL